jgi:hypothetical protein
VRVAAISLKAKGNPESTPARKVDRQVAAGPGWRVVRCVTQDAWTAAGGAARRAFAISVSSSAGVVPPSTRRRGRR